jgi:hypothetical protein
MQCDRSHQLVELCLRERFRARLGLRRRRDRSPKGDEPSEQASSDARRHGTNSDSCGARRLAVSQVRGIGAIPDCTRGEC